MCYPLTATLNVETWTVDVLMFHVDPRLLAVMFPLRFGTTNIKNSTLQMGFKQQTQKVKHLKTDPT